MALHPFTEKVSGRSVVGSKGEKLAIDFLKKSGLRILSHNCRFGRREVDIIAQDKYTICFIEVKTRRSLEFGFPQEAITEKKKHHLTTSALSYIKKHSLENYNFRFDVVAVILDNSKQGYSIDYIKDAFIVDGKWGL